MIYIDFVLVPSSNSARTECKEIRKSQIDKAVFRTIIEVLGVDNTFGVNARIVNPVIYSRVNLSRIHEASVN